MKAKVGRKPVNDALINPTKLLEPIRRERRVSRRVPDVLMPKIRLERARIVAVVCELVKMFLPEGVCMASMKKEDARRAILSEYDRWAKKHPNDATMMGGFLFFRSILIRRQPPRSACS